MSRLALQFAYAKHAEDVPHAVYRMFFDVGLCIAWFRFARSGASCSGNFLLESKKPIRQPAEMSDRHSRIC